MKKPTLPEKIFLRLLGYKTTIANEGRPVEDLVIKHRDIYMSILLDGETGEPTGHLSWTKEQSNASPVTSVNEYYTTVKMFGDGL